MSRLETRPGTNEEQTIEVSMNELLINEKMQTQTTMMDVLTCERRILLVAICIDNCPADGERLETFAFCSGVFVFKIILLNTLFLFIMYFSSS
jgi:hypothetical protein